MLPLAQGFAEPAQMVHMYQDDFRSPEKSDGLAK